ncbi:MAG TPA: FAD:protein FMN transferase [bacterium]|nr:FAD:protein FMN transferase [bacterium]
MRRASIVSVFSLILLASCGRGPAEYSAERRAMGTVVLARAVAADEETARRAVEAALEAVARDEKVASYWDPRSELSRLNRAAAEGPTEVSPELFELVKLARETAAATDGYFDPTVAPVIELYGIKGGTPRWPDDAEVAAAMEAVGYEKILLDPEGRTVAYARPGMALELSGIAKGWAVDRAAAAMAKEGATAGLVEAGGEVACFGGGPKAGEEWRVGVQHPDRDGLYATFDLASGACATSGGYAQRYEADGRKFSHLFDPRTGRPVDGPAGVTVVAETCARADAWATALAVMPAAEVSLLLKPAGAPSCLILRRRGTALEHDVYGEFPDFKEITGVN